MTAEPDLLPALVAEGLDFFDLAGDEGDKLYVRAIRQHIAAQAAEIEALRAEVERWKIAGREWLDKTEWVQQTIKPRELGRHRADILRERIQRSEARAEQLAEALRIAEAALADIGDADREPGDDVAWCERRAAQALPTVRAALHPTAAQGNDDA